MNDKNIPPQADSASEVAPDDASASPTSLSFTRVLEALEKGTFDTIQGLIQWSSNYTFLGSISHEGFQLPVVYKPQRGERPLWDFPEGTLCYRERATFLISEALDWKIVPPTVLREGPRGLGSVQFFVDHDPNYHYFEFDQSMLPQLARMALFDAIINNADRKGGHCIVDSQGHLWGIDHGISFHAAPKLRTVIWDFAGQPIPQVFLTHVIKLAQKLRNSDHPLQRELLTLLSEREVNALSKRLNQLVTVKRYPLPGPGPNRPWPPV